MRICLVSADFYPNVGGVAAHVVELGKALVKNGHQVDVFTLPLGGERQRTSSLFGMTVHRPAIPKAKPFFNWGMHWTLNRFIQRQAVDVLHVHGLRPLEATRGFEIPVLFTNHTSGFLKRIEGSRWERWRMRRRMTHLDAVLAPSEELAQATRDIGYEGPVKFIANGVDPDRFQPQSLVSGSTIFRDQWGIQPGEVVLLLARRLVEKNGVCVFAEAVNQLRDENVRVVFAGDGAERSAIENILRQGGMLERSIFLSNVPNAEMPKVYRSCDISVLPSFYEATSITGLESMSCGLPLVGTRVGGIPAIVIDHETGLLVEAHQPAALASAIRSLVHQPALRAAMGERARHRILESFSWSQIAQQTTEMYQQAIQSQAALSATASDADANGDLSASQRRAA